MANGKKRLFNPFLENLEPAFCGSNICKMNHTTKTAPKNFYFFGLFILLCLAKADAQKKTNPTEGNSVPEKWGQNDSAANFKNQYIIRFDVKNGSIKLPIVDNGKAKIKNPKVGQFIRIIFDSVPKYIQVGADALFFDKNLENAGTFQSLLVKYQGALENEADSATSTRNNGAKQKEAEIKNKIEEQVIVKDTINQISISLTDSLNNLSSKIEKLLSDNEKNLLYAVSDSADRILLELNSIKWKEIPDSLQESINRIKKSITKIKVNSTKNIQSVAGFKKTIKNENENLLSSIKELSTLLVLKLDSSKRVQESLKEKLNLRNTELKSLQDYLLFPTTKYIQPIQVDNRDFTQLAIRYTDTSGNTTAREITLKNRSGFKLDFSTGFIGTGLVDENYRVEPHPTSADTGIIRNDSKGKFAIGFAILSHAYFRTGRRVNFSLNAGLMLNGGNQTINYITGLSMPLGLEQRFVLSGGLAFGKIKTLTNGYVANGSYKSILNTGVPYTEAWRKNWYLGITYNISGLAGNSQAKVVRGSKE